MDLKNQTQKREIEFRAKSINAYNKGQWVYGVPCENEQGDWQMFKKGERVYSIDPSTIGQFTGLTDKKGTKIYEGDILNIDKTHQLFGDERNCKVEFVDQSGRFHLIGTFYDNIREGISDISGKNCCEVVGSIHMN